MVLRIESGTDRRAGERRHDSGWRRALLAVCVVLTVCSALSFPAASRASSVGSPSVSADSLSVGATDDLVTFTFTATTALPAGGTITVTLPTGGSFGQNASGACQQDCAVYDETQSGSGYDFDDATWVSGSGSTMTISVPDDISAGDTVKVYVADASNGSTVGASGYSIATSSDTTPVAFPDQRLIAATQASNPGVAPDSLSVDATDDQTTYTFVSTSRLSGGYDIGLPDGGLEPETTSSTITLTLPTGSTWGENASQDCGDESCTVSDASTGSATDDTSWVAGSGSSMTIAVPLDINAGDTVVVTVDDADNGSTVGASGYGVATSSDPIPATIPADQAALLAQTSPGAVSADVSPATSGAVATYTVDLTASAQGALAGGYGQDADTGGGAIVLSGPSGTDFTGGSDTITDLSKDPNDQDVTGGFDPSQNGASVDLTLDQDVAAGDRLRVTVSGVVNAPSGGAESLDVSTTSEPAAVPATYTLDASATAISGTVSDAGGLVSDAPVQACPTGGGPCATTQTDQNGAFSLAVAAGTYTVTALYPAADGHGPSSVTVAGESPADGAPINNLSLQLPTPELDPNTTVTQNGQVIAGLNELYWAAPFTYQTTGCDGGVGELDLTGTNRDTGAVTHLHVPLLETAPDTGTYVADVPPVAPIHGAVFLHHDIVCPSSSSLYPDGGTAAGGDRVTIYGTGFTGATSVTFGGVAAPSVTVVNDDELSVVAPAGSGVVPVVVTTPDGATSASAASMDYHYFDVTGVSPDTGSVAGGNTVTITGSGFTGLTAVYFGAVPADDFDVVSDTEIQAVVPSGTAGTVDVQVGNPFRFSAVTAADRYGYGGAPSTTPVPSAPTPPAPASGGGPTPTGQAPTPASACSILALLDPQDSCAVALPALAHVPQTSLATGSSGGGAQLGLDLTCDDDATPDPLGGSGHCTGEEPSTGGGGGSGGGGSAGGSDGGSDDTGPNPGEGTYIDPSGNVVDTFGDAVSGATVTILNSTDGGNTFSVVPNGSDLIIPSTNPETTDASGGFDWDAIAGEYEIQATKSGCTAPGSAALTATTSPFVLPPPKIGLLLTLDCGGSGSAPTVTALDRSVGPAAGGTDVTLTGTGLADVSAVDFGATPATAFTVLGPTTITAVAPAGTGAQPVTVVSQGRMSPSSSAPVFTYLGAPTVASLSPSHGPAAGGTRVTVSGTGLADATGVTLGGVSLPFTPVSDSGLLITVPAGAAGTSALVVSTPCAANQVPPGATACGTSDAVPYTYDAAPSSGGSGSSGGGAGSSGGGAGSSAPGAAGVSGSASTGSPASTVGTSPGASVPAPVAPSSRPALGAVTVAGRTVTVSLSCPRGGTACAVVLELTVATDRAHSARRTRPVVVARASATVAPGRRRTVRLTLDGAGRRLLAAHHRLATRLSVVEGSDVVANRTVRLTAPRRRRR